MPQAPAPSRCLMRKRPIFLGRGVVEDQELGEGPEARSLADVGAGPVNSPEGVSENELPQFLQRPLRPTSEPSTEYDRAQ